MAGPAGLSISQFLRSIKDEEQRAICGSLDKIMQDAAGAKGKVWSKNMVGYGDYHYRYESGREADWFCFGFSPRSGSVSLYITGKLDDKERAKLGDLKPDKGCIHIKKTKDIDPKALTAILKSVAKRLRANPNTDPYKL